MFQSRVFVYSVNNKINKNDIIWGAAGKGVMMMNILDLDYKHIPFIVDDVICGFNNSNHKNCYDILKYYIPWLWMYYIVWFIKGKLSG